MYFSSYDNLFLLGILNKITKIRKNKIQEDHQENRMPKQGKIIIFKKLSNNAIIEEREQLLFDLECTIYLIRNKKKLEGSCFLSL